MWFCDVWYTAEGILTGAPFCCTDCNATASVHQHGTRCSRAQQKVKSSADKTSGPFDSHLRHFQL